MHRAPPSSRSRTQRGMSLLEVMLLTFVLGGALVAGFITLKARTPADAAQSQSRVLAEADRALAGFAAANNRLPCPDTNRDGFEDCGGNAQKGWLPYRTLGLEGAGVQAGVGALRYLVQRNAVDLAVATDTWQPVAFKNNIDLYTTTRSFTPGNISTADLCGKTATGIALTTVAANNAQLAATVPRAVAYALAHPGTRDEGNSGQIFDGVNGDSGNSMEAPERGTLAGSYDDRVLERTYASLALALDCRRLNASLDQLSLATEIVEQVNTQRENNHLMAGVLSAVNLVKAGVSVYKVYAAAVQVSTAAGYMSTSASLLSAAIASCVFLVGCFEIPHATASVIASALSIVASATAVVASATSVALSITASGYTIAAAVQAGNSSNANFDISAAVAQALTTRNEVTAQKNTAYNTWQSAVSSEASLLALKDARIADAYTAAHAIVAAANAAGDPDGTLAATALDSYVTTTINAAAAWMTAVKNYNDATEAWENAKKTTSGGPTGENTSLTAAIAEYDAKIAAEADPDKKQALIAARAALINGSAGAGTNAEQKAKLGAQLTELNQQIAGLDSQVTTYNGQIGSLNTQIAAAPANVAELTAQRDSLASERDSLVGQRPSLVAQRDQVQTQYNTVALDVASAKANMDAMFALIAPAKAAFRAAYDAAVAAARLPYRDMVCTLVPRPGTVSPNIIYDTVCVPSPIKYYEGGPAMDTGLRRLFHTEGVIFEDIFHPVIGIVSYDDGVYFKWFQQAQKVTVTKNAYDQLVAKETSAIESYNSLVAISTGNTPTGSVVQSWSGAEAILKQADSKGGIR